MEILFFLVKMRLVAVAMRGGLGMGGGDVGWSGGGAPLADVGKWEQIWL